MHTLIQALILGFLGMLLEASPLDVTINIDDSPTTHKGYSPAEKVPHLLNVVGKEYFNNALCIGPWETCSGVVGPKCCEPYHCFRDKVHCPKKGLCCTPQTKEQENEQGLEVLDREGQLVIADEHTDGKEFSPMLSIPHLEQVVVANVALKTQNITGILVTTIYVLADGHQGEGKFSGVGLNVGDLYAPGSTLGFHNWASIEGTHDLLFTVVNGDMTVIIRPGNQEANLSGMLPGVNVGSREGLIEFKAV